MNHGGPWLLECVETKIGVWWVGPNFFVVRVKEGEASGLVWCGVLWDECFIRGYQHSWWYRSMDAEFVIFGLINKETYSVPLSPAGLVINEI